MTVAALYVPSGKKIACLLDKATAACSIAKLRHYHLSARVDCRLAEIASDGRGGEEGDPHREREKAVIMTADVALA